MHEVIQASMDWDGYHLHVFPLAPWWTGSRLASLDFADERNVTLGHMLCDIGDRARYTYDFGDDWEHEMVLQKILVADPDTIYPLCSAGKGACPPEDCGGRWGYEHLREVLADPDNSEHEDMLEWLGLGSASEFDPADFDPDEVAAELAIVS